MLLLSLEAGWARCLAGWLVGWLVLKFDDKCEAPFAQDTDHTQGNKQAASEGVVVVVVVGVVVVLWTLLDCLCFVAVLRKIV